MNNVLRKSMFDAWEFAGPYGVNGDTTRTAPRKKPHIGSIIKVRTPQRKVTLEYTRQELQAI